MEEPDRFEELRSAYDAAFERLCGAPDAEEAQLAYRKTRDELAEFILEQRVAQVS